jgi:hypothetical protein
VRSGENIPFLTFARADRGKPLFSRGTRLAAAHEKGIVDQVLRRANVFITRNGRIKILDFVSRSRRSGGWIGLRLIRFGGHLPKGGYDVQTDGRDDQKPASTPTVR